MENIVSFISKNSQVIIAIIAVCGVIQVWIIALWNKYFRKAKVDFYLRDMGIIGFANYGPIVSLYGTISALNKDVFVNAIDLHVTRDKDKSQHNFEWFAFGSSQINPITEQSIYLEIASGFLATPKAPYRSLISFRDRESWKDMMDIVIKQQQEFNKYVFEKGIIVREIGANPNCYSPESIDHINNFSKESVTTESYAKLGRIFYWYAGDYTIELLIKTSRPDKTYRKKYKFTISELDSSNLRSNIIAILNYPISNLLNIPNYLFVCTYPELIEVK